MAALLFTFPDLTQELGCLSSRVRNKDSQRMRKILEGTADDTYKLPVQAKTSSRPKMRVDRMYPLLPSWI